MVIKGFCVIQLKFYKCKQLKSGRFQCLKSYARFFKDKKRNKKNKTKQNKNNSNNNKRYSNFARDPIRTLSILKVVIIGWFSF